ncbi:MarR family transcriptional regulator [Rhodobacteraceae bacterium CCMM004]|nr:MarR family transcriptional regulator [Rhodobacteraceae bacterium CCMM004]
MTQPQGDRMARHETPPTTVRRRPLDQRVSFLTHRINARLQQLCNPVIAPCRLDLYSSRIIVALAERGAMKVGELVDLMALPQSTMSHQLKRLEKNGYVRRTRSDVDNRTVVITLTDRGVAVAETCNRLSDCVLTSVSQNLSPEEIETLSRLLQRVFDSLPKEGDIVV